MAAAASGDAVVTPTLDDVESRLRSLEFLFSGSSNFAGQAIPPAKPQSHNETIAARLENLEHQLERLASQSQLVRDVLLLHKRHPSIFTSPDPTSSLDPAKLDPSVLISIVLAHSSAYPETASRLSSLKDLPIPPAASSAQLADLQPRIDVVMKQQEQLEKELEELRRRSAAVVERWVRVGVVGLGEVWAEWEERIKRVERDVTRAERAREREEG